MQMDAELFQKQLADVEGGKLVHLKIEHYILSEQEIDALCSTLKKSTNLQQITLFKTPLGNDGAIKLADALVKNPTITQVHLTDNQIGDEGIVALATILRNPDLSQVFFNQNDIGTDGAAAINQAIEETNSKNLVLVGFSDSSNLQGIFPRCKINLKAARSLCEKIPEVATCTPDEWHEMAERISAIRYMDTDKADAFEAFCETLPTVSENITAEILLTKNEAGITPLDNPKTIANFTQVVEEMNRNGVQLQGGDLLREGKASPLLEKIIARGIAPAIFTQTNWAGASAEELKTALKFIPENQRAEIPHRHALMASLENKAAISR